jgi:hypothetical protein
MRAKVFKGHSAGNNKKTGLVRPSAFIRLDALPANALPPIEHSIVEPRSQPRNWSA